MMSVSIWWTAIALESLVLFRSLRQGLFSIYPFFYFYLASVLAFDISRYAIYVLAPSVYPKWYWAGQFVSLVAGYGVLLEIFGHVLSPYRGAERFAKIAGLIAFGLIFCFAVIYPLIVAPLSPAATEFQLERDLRMVQSIFLFGVLAVISYYRIAIGKNMKGMIFGYGLYIGTSLTCLAIRSYTGAPLYGQWDIVTQQISYAASLLIWAVALWAYYPNPLPDLTSRLETDYETFVAETRARMGAVRSHLVKAVRP